MTSFGSLADLIGRTSDEVRSRLGDPDVDRVTGGDRWFVFRAEGLTLRVRCEADGQEADGDGAVGPEAGEGATGSAPSWRVASWTAVLDRGADTLREAVEPLGLWPACAPDAEAASVERPLLRRALPAPGRSHASTHSLTATIRRGRITRVTAFDEPPDWL